MKTAIYKDYEEFLSRKDKNLNGVSVEFAERYPDYENDNVTNKRLCRLQRLHRFHRLC